MPQPSQDTLMPSPPPDLSSRSTCPPETVRPHAHSSETAIDAHSSITPDGRATLPEQPSHLATPPADHDSQPDVDLRDPAPAKRMDTEDDGPLRDTPSPVSAAGDAADCDRSSLQSPAFPSTASDSWYPHLYGSAWPEHRVRHTHDSKSARSMTDQAAHSSSLIPLRPSSVLAASSRVRSSPTAKSTRYRWR